MKNCFKLKTFSAFLLTMIMVTSLFLFSGCGTDDERFLFKVVYRPYLSEGCGIFSSYEDAVTEEVEYVATEFITHTVGSFGMGKIEHELKDGEKAEPLSPELTDEYYYDSLLDIGLQHDSDQYSDIISKLACCNNFMFLTKMQGTKTVEDGDSSYKDYVDCEIRALVLSNQKFDKSTVEGLVSYDDDEKTFYSYSTLLGLRDGITYKSNKKTMLSGDSAYFCDWGSEYYFVILGSYSYSKKQWEAHIGWDSVKHKTYDISDTLGAEELVEKILSTNYNSIQSNISSIRIWEDSPSDLNVLVPDHWQYYLTEKEMNSVYSPQDYLDAYLAKYLLDYEVQVVKCILTRGESELTESLEKKYITATKNNSTTAEKKAFIKECCQYIDHLGLIEDETEALLNFLLETAIGDTIAYNNKPLEESCKKMLKGLIDEIGYTPLLEVLNFNASELNEIKIDGYIQSIIFSKKEDYYQFSDFICFFDTENLESEIVPFDVTVRFMDRGTVEEYPITVDEKDIKEGVVVACLSDVLEDDQTYIEMPPSKDPIPLNLLSLELIERQVKIINRAEDFKDKFIYSTSTEHTGGYAWCLNDEECSYVQVVFGQNSLCLNQHLDLLIMAF